MTCGEIWTAAAGSGSAGKPRPAVVIQDDRFDATDSLTIIAFTTDPTEAPLFRLPITPSPQNGRHDVSSLMVDKITTLRRSKLGERVGRLSSEDMVRLDRAIVVFRGLAGSWGGNIHIGQEQLVVGTNGSSSSTCQSGGSPTPTFRYWRSNSIRREHLNTYNKRSSSPHGHMWPYVLQWVYG